MWFQKLGCLSKLKENLVTTIEATVLLFMFVLKMSWMSKKYGLNVMSKSMSPAQIRGKLSEHSRGIIVSPVFKNLGESVYFV